MTSQPRPWRSEGLECRRGSEVCSRLHHSSSGPVPGPGLPALCPHQPHPALASGGGRSLGCDRQGEGVGEHREPSTGPSLCASPKRPRPASPEAPDPPPPPGRDRPATKGTVPHGPFPAHCCPHYFSALTPTGVVFPRGGTATCPVSLVCVFPCSLRPVSQPAMSGPLGGFQLVAFVNCAVLNIFDF